MDFRNQSSSEMDDGNLPEVSGGDVESNPDGPIAAFSGASGPQQINCHGTLQVEPSLIAILW